MTIKLCEVCNAPVHSQSTCCKRCNKLLGRIDTRKHIPRNRQSRLQALKDAYNKSGDFFQCYYTGIPLVEDNHRSPRYLTFDHYLPRDESRIVLAAQLINDMKSDMTDSEFRFMVRQLANRFDGGTFDEKAFDLKHWKR